MSEDASEPSLPLSSENFSLTVVCECFLGERNGQSVLSGAARPSFLSPGVDKSLRQLPASEPHPLWEHLRREVRLRARAQRCLHGKQLRGVVLWRQVPSHRGDQGWRVQDRVLRGRQLPAPEQAVLQRLQLLAG